MKTFVLCNDRGIAPDGSKGASAHLRGWVEALTSLGVDVHTFTRREGGGGTFPSPLHALEDAATLDAEVLASGLPDLIYERYSLGSAVGLAWARSHRRPFVLEVNAPLVDEASAFRPNTVSPEDREVEQRLLREADVVVAVSAPLASWVAERRGGKPVLVVPNGCDPRHRPRAEVRERDVGTVVFLGHPKPWHGADRLVPLIAALEARGLPARLLVIGGGSGADALHDAARTRGLLHRLAVTGPLGEAEVGVRLLEADVAVAPYPRHPFFYFCPLKVISSMMAGLPVVATDQGDVETLLGGTGVLVPPDDDAALVNAVAGLLESPARRASLGAAARMRALDAYTWEASARRFLDVLPQVLVGSPVS